MLGSKAGSQQRQPEQQHMTDPVHAPALSGSTEPAWFPATSPLLLQIGHGHQNDGMSSLMLLCILSILSSCVVHANLALALGAGEVGHLGFGA